MLLVGPKGQLSEFTINSKSESQSQLLTCALFQRHHTWEEVFAPWVSTLGIMWLFAASGAARIVLNNVQCPLWGSKAHSGEKRALLLRYKIN